MVELVDCRVNNKYRNYAIACFLVCAFSLYTSIYFVRKARAERQVQKRYLIRPNISDEFILSDVSDEQRLIVRTSSGSLEGKKVKFFSTIIDTFLGVPYAEPPIGELRFSSPVPIEPWDEVRQAFHFSPMCSQNLPNSETMRKKYINNKTSEDCLTLNIWTPNVKPKQLRTVMVWIHGGAFNYNSANLHDTDGRVLATFGDVVVVTVNYRVGIFGFLNTRTVGAPGNMGIYDQALALQWIKDNIRHFGGDPEKIVPFGASSGAISVGLLMNFNNTKHLFTRAITQSGNYMIPYSKKSFDYSVKLAKLVDCLNDQNKEKFEAFTEEEVECLKNVPSDELLEATKSFYNRTHMPFIPSIDGFHRDINSITKSIGDKNSFDNIKELLIGVVRDEGSSFLIRMNDTLFQNNSFPQIKTLKDTQKLFIDLANNKTDYSKGFIKKLSQNLITGQAKDSALKNIKRLSRAFGDLFINCPTIVLSDELVARNKSIYSYVFSHRPKNNGFAKWMGSSHYQDVQYVFGFPLRHPELHNKEDIIFSERLMKIWSHFAKTGKVLPQLDLSWPEYNNYQSFMVLHPIQSSLIKDINSKSCALYKTLINSEN